jgi:MoxR-like ATPase
MPPHELEAPAGQAALVEETGRRRIAALEANVSRALRGKQDVVRLALVSLLARGHLLIEDVPGVGKTTLAQALARSARARFHRIQFTADMLPSDVLGVTIFNAHSQEFEFKRGPVFTQFLLADEINRATPKTQSALLEAMNEHQVTMDGRSYPLEAPFMVIATQNPVEHQGTYPLPESQLDRFLLRLRIGYPEQAAEREILRHSSEAPSVESLQPVIDTAELLELQTAVGAVRVDTALEDYLLAIVEKTRTHEALTLGVSPRGSQALYRAAQALALLEGRTFVLPDDIKTLVPAVFGHRIAVSSRTLVGRSRDASLRVLQDILTEVDVPL